MRRWSQNFQGRLDDIFAIQSQIGNAVAGNLRQQIVLTAPVSPPPRGEVHALYLTARGLMRERTPAKIESAIALLRHAVQLDPRHAPSWSSLGLALHLYNFYGSVAADQRRPREQEALGDVRRALALDPNLAEAHAAYGLMRISDPDGVRHLGQAVRLEPGNAEAWYWLYQARSAGLDYEGALRAIRRTAELDPFWTLSKWYASLASSLGYRDEAMRYWQMIASRHPSRFERTVALWSIANHQNDLSAAYRLAHAGSQIASADMLEYSKTREAAALFRLGLFDRAERLVSPPDLFLTMVHGQAPSLPEVQGLIGDLANFWSMDEMRLMLPRLLLNSGRGQDLVLLYDRAFRSPEDMARRHPGGHEGFVEDAANLAVALREAGRGAEADRLLVLAARMIDDTMRHGRVPLRFKANAAAVWAVQGRRDAALAALGEVISAGWRWQSTSVFPPLAEQPAFRSLRDDPRFGRWDATMRAELARERREVLANGP
jgi:tetratricopeptide (TPR) repeat protein